ncbi:type 1 fimbrial protein [Salmonella enterica]|uniref:Type 1 fimbrial protein n=5 Tax=Salmonella enterica TaxID=28901 RepID=A0A5V0T1F7_SALER|nr:type 1 fimbrial protein [Salmonella enterica]ECH8236384.1 type 1 fimbrial protein [Salmonella enterica subsp. enterica]ECJ7613260.1 type 1 fimbrial protein [Salmonella enterica subsp. enterica serovar Sandiego]ECS7537545.1 type 1 fimbrial protein [Salmonella enterica subsp. enterica serovar Newport]ECU9092984.1 type 1 fimbrial protein [Salmonella enterica subsp. enterica serovar Cotham]EDB3360125.1 type 1 fimbrial protein [Salmonella enterica subsp. enterica serovar Bredeney]EDC6799244.1 t
MKKSMAGQGAAGALLLAGLMMSAGAMAASGDPVQGGSGSVTINVPIVTSTCSVTVPTEVNFEAIDKKSIIGDGSYVATKTMDITLSGCSGKTLLMSTRAHAISPTLNVDGYFSSGDPDHALIYRIFVPRITEITGGKSITGSGSNWIMHVDNTVPLTIKPNSDNYRIASSIALRSLGKNITNLGTTVSGGFDYTFTYQ